MRLHELRGIEIGVERQVVVDHHRPCFATDPQQVGVAGQVAQGAVGIAHPPVESHQVAPEVLRAVVQQRRLEVAHVLHPLRTEGRTRGQVVVTLRVQRPDQGLVHLGLRDRRQRQAEGSAQPTPYPFADHTAPVGPRAFHVPGVAVIRHAQVGPRHALRGALDDLGDQRAVDRHLAGSGGGGRLDQGIGQASLRGAARGEALA